MFERLKSMFSKKEKTVPETKVISFKDSEKLFEDKVKDLEKNEFKEINNKVETITENFRTLQKILEELKSLDVPEKRAHASQVIKDKWVERNEPIIINFLNNSGEVHNEKELDEYIISAGKTIETVRISPVEAGHIQFFFSEQLGKISRSINALSDGLNSLKTSKETGILKKKNDIQNLYHRKEQLEESIAKNSSEMEKLDYEITDCKKKLSEIEFYDVKELDETNTKIHQLDLEKRRINQKIDSSFGSITRYLRKFLHKSSNKLDNNIISQYLENPHKAFLEDDNAKIRDILLKLIIFVKDERIEIENRSIQKIEDILSEIDSLTEQKKRLSEIDEEIDNLKQKIENELIPREEKNKSNIKTKAHLEKEIEKDEQKVIQLQEENESQKQSITIVTRKISDRLSMLLGHEIKIE